MYRKKNEGFAPVLLQCLCRERGNLSVIYWEGKNGVMGRKERGRHLLITAHCLESHCLMGLERGGG